MTNQQTIPDIVEKARELAEQLMDAFWADFKSGPRYANGKAIGTSYSHTKAVERIAAALAEARAVPQLHHDTEQLVDNFSAALKEKLLRAQIKYGYSNSWRENDWKEKCQSDLAKHIIKGDPMDVAAYCAFLWFHGWSSCVDKESNYCIHPDAVAPIPEMGEKK